MKPVIVFASSVCPAQFSGLCQYLNETGMAEAYYLTTPGHVKTYQDKYDNLIPFQPDGAIVGAQSYYYSAKTERSARIGRGIYRALAEFQKTKKIDVVVTHALWGAPMFLYDEIDAAIVSYIEFPSYHAHGWDPKYPPDVSQRLTDRNMEMLSFHQVLKSDLTIVPSAYARSLFPFDLQSRIDVQFEGFDVKPLPPQPAKSEGDTSFTIGFSARDLSSAKGFETYVRLVDRMVRDGTAERIGARFIAIGGKTGSTYGYEQQWVERKMGKDHSFADYLLTQYPAAACIEFPGKLPYDQFAAKLAGVDLFLYPLQFGVANWGLMEILARGKPIIASNRTFVPELIEHGKNGLVLPENDGLWLREIERLAGDAQARAALGAQAAHRAKAYHLKAVAPRYLTLFEKAIARRKAALLN